jgi:predicted DNA-binding transcriptional regulator AlpA
MITQDTDKEASTVSIDETARILGVSRGSVFNLRKRKGSNFPSPVPFSLRNVRFYRADVEAFAKHGATWQIARLR